MLQQQIHNVGMAFGGSPHQRSLAAISLLGVHVSAVVDESFYGIQIPGARGRHQNGLAVGGGTRVGIGTGF